MKKINLKIFVIFTVLVTSLVSVSAVKAFNSVPTWRVCDPSENVFKEGMVGMNTAGEGLKYVWNSEKSIYEGPFHTVNPGEKGYTSPLVAGGNISGFYPGCVIDLGSGGKFYFYHPVGK